MAAVVGTVQDAFGFTTPVGPKRNAANVAIEFCYVTITYAGTYAQGANAATCAALATAIANKRRDGRTITVLQVGCAAPGSEAGVAQGAIGVSMSGTTLQCQLTTGDLATEHANAAMGVYDSGVCFGVMYSAA